MNEIWDFSEYDNDELQEINDAVTVLIRLGIDLFSETFERELDTELKLRETE